jgi:hypothetical protein
VSPCFSCPGCKQANQSVEPGKLTDIWAFEEADVSKGTGVPKGLWGAEKAPMAVNPLTLFIFNNTVSEWRHILTQVAKTMLARVYQQETDEHKYKEVLREMIAELHSGELTKSGSRGTKRKREAADDDGPETPGSDKGGAGELDEEKTMSKILKKYEEHDFNVQVRARASLAGGPQEARLTLFIRSSWGSSTRTC